MELTIPILQQWHEEFNKRYFNNELELPLLELTLHNSRFGDFSRRYGKGTSKIRISIMWIRTEYAYKNTLLHEMVHQYIKEKKLKDTSPHGVIFKRIAAKLNKDGWQIQAGYGERSAKAIGFIAVNPKAKRNYYVGVYTSKSSGRYCVFRFAPAKMDYYIRWFEMHPNFFINPMVLLTDDLYFNDFTICRKQINGERYLPIADFNNKVWSKKKKILYRNGVRYQ